MLLFLLLSALVAVVVVVMLPWWWWWWWYACDCLRGCVHCSRPQYLTRLGISAPPNANAVPFVGGVEGMAQRIEQSLAPRFPPGAYIGVEYEGRFRLCSVSQIRVNRCGECRLVGHFDLFAGLQCKRRSFDRC